MRAKKLQTELTLPIGLRLLGAVLLLLFAALILSFAFAARQANRLELDNEKAQLDNMISRATERLAAEQKGEAVWDEMIQNLILKFDIEWIDREIGRYKWVGFHHDLTVLLDDRDQPLVGYLQGAEVRDGSLSRLIAPAVPLIRRIRDMPAETGRVRSHTRSPFRLPVKKADGTNGAEREVDIGAEGGLVMFDGGPALASVMTIRPNGDAGLDRAKPYLFLTIKRLEATFFDGLGKSLLLEKVQHVDALPSRLPEALMPLRSDAGEAIGYLSWNPRTPGTQLLYTVMPLLLLLGVSCLVAGGFTMSSLQRGAMELAASQTQASFLAMHDQMSGLPNRLRFIRALAEALIPDAQGESTPTALVFLDVDRFKDINDALGHHAGDELILAVAARLGSVLQPRDLLARFGGDEFAVLRPRIASTTDAQGLARSILTAFSSPFQIGGGETLVKVSCGLVLAPFDGLDCHSLMRKADIALYRVKSQGGNGWCQFTEEMDEKIQQRHQIERDLKRALSANELRLEYQPLIGSDGVQLVGVEALLRWSHPRLGEISPGLFVPVAEECGAMFEIGQFVLRTAFVEAMRWGNLNVALNISPVQLRHPEFVETLTRLAAETGVRTSLITLEITEGVLMDRAERTANTLRAISRLGFRIALDDFGTGYSSLGYLRRYPFHKLKIDRSFVEGIESDQESRSIVLSIIALARSLGLEIVAEGVQTHAQQRFLVEAGCHELQGWLFYKALPKPEIDSLLMAQRRRLFSAAS